MGIDPRTIKELLQLQILNKTSLLSKNGSTSEPAEDSDFSELLNSLLTRQQDLTLDRTGSLTGKPIAAEGTSVLPSKLGIGGPITASLNFMHERAGASKPTDFEPLIQAASRKFGVESSLVKAVIDAESSFNPRAVSQAGAKGLMQLMDGTGQGLGVSDLFDPGQNIEGGTQFLSGLLMKYNGNPGAALAAYNAGPGRLDKLGIKNDDDLASKLHLLPGETQQYVRKVMELKQHYEA